MAATLPTRIKQNLRDQITSPSSAVATKFLSVQKTLGYPISLDPEWTMLWKTLQVFFPEPAEFVPYIANVLIAWCDALVIWLEDGNDEAVDKLLDEVRGGTVGICLEISPSSTRPTTSWNTEKAVFIINVPKGAPSRPQTILSGFSDDLQNLFTASPPLQPTDPSASAVADKDPDSWAHLSLDSPEIQPIRASAPKVDPTGKDFLPEMSTLQRPEELLKTPPYWLVVRQEGRARVTVQGSHAGTLGVLEAYLKRWCRGEPGIVGRPPKVTIRLQESAFGLGLLNDTLVLEATHQNRGTEVSAMLVLVLAESVLGYESLPMNGSAGSVWEFKRTRGFK